MKFRLSKKIGFSRPADFLGLLASWLLFTSVFSTNDTAPVAYVIWVFLTAAISLSLLDAVGYFEHHIPKPEFSDLLSLLMVLPLSALLAKWIILLSYAPVPFRYSEAVWAAPCVALSFELGQQIIFKIHRDMGHKWILATNLEASELQLLRDEVQRSGYSWWIEIRPLKAPHYELYGEETIVTSRKAARHLHDHPELLEAHLRGQEIVDLRQLLKEFRGRVDISNMDAWTYLLASTHKSYPIRLYFYLKIYLEAILAFVLLIVLSPLLLGIAAAVWVTSGRPVIYRQQRLGYQGKQFALYKFRTMAVSAETDGPRWAQVNDKRLSPFGQWLRKTRLDELPQLLNVIFGQLSFVGPRPERPEFYKLLQEPIPLFSLRLLVRPGITGWAQARQGYAGTIEECKLKLEYDLYYVQHMSPQFDLRIISRTVAMMIHGNSGR